MDNTLCRERLNYQLPTGEVEALNHQLNRDLVSLRLEVTLASSNVESVFQQVVYTSHCQDNRWSFFLNRFTHQELRNIIKALPSLKYKIDPIGADLSRSPLGRKELDQTCINEFMLMAQGLQ